MTHRPCHCNTDFRKCLQRYGKIAVCKDLAEAVLRAVNQLKNCEIRDGTACNPNNPKTCRKGDLIDPKYAHCRVNCKTGPLLPIGQRMCRIRQCKPDYVKGYELSMFPTARRVRCASPSAVCRIFAVKVTPDAYVTESRLETLFPIAVAANFGHLYFNTVKNIIK